MCKLKSSFSRQVETTTLKNMNKPFTIYLRLSNLNATSIKWCPEVHPTSQRDTTHKIFVVYMTCLSVIRLQLSLLHKYFDAI